MKKEVDTVAEFFYQNDVTVTKTAVKVARWLIIIFPTLIVLAVLGVFNMSAKDLIPITIVGVIVTLGPTIAEKCKVPVGILKYATILSIEGLVALMGANPRIGIYITYALAMVFSIFYYDKKFTIRISIISAILLTISIFFKSGMHPHIGSLIGYYIELIAMALVCVKCADISHKMLKKFASTQQVANLIEKCNGAAVDLGDVVEKLETCIKELENVNKVVISSANLTVEECNDSFKYVDSVYDSMKAMDETVTIISEKINKMLAGSHETTQKMQEYIVIMEETTTDMKNIKDSAEKTSESIDSLGQGLKEIEQFATTISNITEQTNLLALNASIEAAHAGDMGRGFNVVAREIRHLADDSKQASKSITGIIQKIYGLLEEVHIANMKNTTNVEKGITQIVEVSRQAESVGVVQNEVQEMAEKVVAASEEARACSMKVLQMADEMHSIVQSTVEQVQQIVNQTEGQKKVTESVQHSFRRVERVSKNLLEISSVE